jgi:hypothetical protein
VIFTLIPGCNGTHATVADEGKVAVTMFRKGVATVVGSGFSVLWSWQEVIPKVTRMRQSNWRRPRFKNFRMGCVFFIQRITDLGSQGYQSPPA